MLVHRAEYVNGKNPRGVNLIGPVEQPSGLGQSCRLVKRELEAAGIPVSVVNFSRVGGNCFQGEFKYDINLIHVNMHEFADFVNSMTEDELGSRYNIAFWLWEMPEFPKQWIRLTEIVDEIWTPSEFSSEAVRRITQKPVYTVPYYITVTSNEDLERKDFHLPEDKFLFLMLFDKNSCMERKNPEGVIEAFKKAFSEKDDVGLVVKINNVDRQDVERIKNTLKGYSVYFINEMLSREDLIRLIELCDCYVSMHRAEGYGLVLAESMLLGTPTIATGYSANTEFQSADTACLVNYETVELKKDVSLYHKGDHWADPNVNTCAEYMKKIYSDRAFREQLSQKAKESLGGEAFFQKIIDVIKSRCDDIWNPTAS